MISDRGFTKLATLLPALLLAVAPACKRFAPAAPAPADAAEEAPGPPPPPPAPLEEALRDEVGAGGDVALVADPAGVMALSPDGKRKKLVAPGPVDDVLVDNRSRVIWWKRLADHRSELVVLDLTAPLAMPEVIARGRQDWQRVAVAYEDPKEVLGDDEAATLLVMAPEELRFWRLGRKCTRATRDACLRHDRELCQPGDDESQCPTLAPGARERLQALLERGAGRRVYSPPPRRSAAAAVKKVPVVVGRACPRCGRATLLPGTKLWAVLVEVAGDFCHIVPQAYDPEGKQFLNIQNGARLPRPFADLNAAVGDIWICPSGTSFVGGGTAGTFAKGALAPWRGLSAGGCLGGGWMFGGDKLADRCDEDLESATR
jgi:hypothetical protein